MSAGSCAFVPQVKEAEVTAGLKQNPEAIDKFEETTEERVEQVAAFYLSESFGGVSETVFKNGKVRERVSGTN